MTIGNVGLSGLNERKIRIFEAIINDYIETAEPIGSRTIAKKYGMGISSATIRNEMSDLEEMGLIVQPHASSGRVPSDKGYRLFVDNLMRCRELTQEETSLLQQIIMSNVDKIDLLMQETARILAVLTNCTTVVTQPQFSGHRIKHLQLVPLDEASLVLVVVTDSKAVKNSTVRVGRAPECGDLARFSAIFNEHLRGCSIEDLTADRLDALYQSMALADLPGLPQIFEPVVMAAAKSLQAENDVRVYTGGMRNILAFPEFSDIVKARPIFKALEEKDLLITLLGGADDNSADNINYINNIKNKDEKLQIVIGSENTVESLKDCSVIKGNFKLGRNNYGAIGVIGPTRMDYAQATSVLSVIVKKMNAALKAMTSG